MALGNVIFGQGMTSGINYQAIVDAIINADSAPITSLQKRVDTFKTAQRSFQNLRTALQDFSSKLQKMRTGTAIGGKTTSVSGVPTGATTPFSASAGSDAISGTYEITVQSLAKAHRVRSAGVADAFSQTVSDGQIRIKAGTNEEIVIDVAATSGNNSLSAIASAINGADKGVIASIIQDGTNSMLVVRSRETGTANALTISDSTNLNLDDAANRLQAASNAQIDVDGITVTSQSNTVSNAIPGVTLDLSAELPGTAVRLNVADDISGTKKTIGEFVEAYNAINAQFDKELGSAAALKNSAVGGSSVYRNMQLQLQSLLTSTATGVADGRIDSLAELGIQIADGTGRLEFKSETFDEIVEQGRFDEVRAVLQSTGSTSDPSVGYVSSTSLTKAGTYDIRITQAAQQAFVTGSTVVGAGGITANETLTFTLDGSTQTVDLAAGDTLSAIVSKINTTMTQAGFGVRAEDSGGRLLLRSVEYGSAYTLSVGSSVADAADGNSTGIGTTQLTDTGVDVAGTINGAAATGYGRDLVAGSSTDANGLAIRVYATDALVASKAGNFGTVGFSQGIADRFDALIDRLTDPLDGTIKSALDSYDDSIELANDKIASIRERLAGKREILTRQFSAAEQAITSLNQMLASLNR